MKIESLFILDGITSPDIISLDFPVFLNAEVRIHNDASFAASFLSAFNANELGNHEKRAIEAAIPSSIFISLSRESNAGEFTTDTHREYMNAVGVVGMSMGFFSSILFLIRPHALQLPFVLSIVEVNEKRIYLKDHTVLNLHSLVGENDLTSISASDVDRANRIFSTILSPIDVQSDIDHELSTRVVALIQSARESSIAAQSVALIVSALECLVLRKVEYGEYAHQFSERLASLVCKQRSDRIELYKKAKKLYGVRSSYFHGSNIENTTTITGKIKDATEFLNLLILSENEDTLKYPFLFKKLDQQDYLAEMLQRVLA